MRSREDQSSGSRQLFVRDRSCRRRGRVWPHWGRLLACSMILVLSMAASSCLAQPPVSEAPQQIAYLGEGGSVWLTDAEGAETVQLADALGFEALEWAPDGESLALVKGRPIVDGDGEIYVVDAEGGEPTKVADGYAPVWSSDSQRILYVTNFTATEEGTEQSLKLWSLEDGSETILATERWISGLWPIENVQCSAGDALIAVYVGGLEMEGFVVIVNAQGELVWEIEDFVYGADDFSWAPGDQRLVYRDSGQPFMGGEEPSLKIVRADTQETVHTLEEPAFWPRWSPQGDRIAAFLWEEGGAFRAVIVDADSGEVVLRSEEVFGDLWSSRPIWSPDGGSLLFAASQDGQMRLYVMDSSDGQLHSIAEGERPDAVWAPDGASVAVSMGQEGSRELFVVAADGSDLRRIAAGWMPRWRPVGGAE
jgi:dipeptidyl aminopeptidase/acylaminoacyl peptidase